MAKPRKQKHYLDDIGDPHLPEDRGMALRFMFEVTVWRADENSLPEPIDFAKDEVHFREQLCCVNCDSEVLSSALFCSDLCRQIAQTVRYVRKAEADQRITIPDVQIGIGMRLFMLTGGGYPQSERALSKEQRQEILKRDAYTCKLCSMPADQVDHIVGSSNEPDNLRALCGDCNRKEAFSHKRVATDEESDDIREMFSDMAQRVASPAPIYLCDDSERWSKCWPGIMGARRRRFNGLKREVPEMRRAKVTGRTAASRPEPGPRITICEVRDKRGLWEIVSVDRAIELGKSVEKRCVECHGRVRTRDADQLGVAYVEHILEHAGCSIGGCYDGNGSRLHRAAVI